ncbi:4-(cytidine 5'-diphospho)-2-C-methyl-D-erythritol kinase [Chelativorans sp.]|uniref:4-(cytidine 5'-diphospho)-2-C-methyl-D-erythritol kinase n=1 Tax=Chelativorans sp. TaxID=2203393 RepID=UPI002810C328|nr:4-(cytidine 5'-diphospho)-2-C-methyl-D-erythritol kinase [Chelativorans sp.]
MRLEAAAPAKVNLALHVTGRRGDGYHLIETLVVFTRYGDRLRVEEAERDSLTLGGPFAALLAGADPNLVLRARDLLRRHFGAVAERPVAIHLEKNLPVAAGIGGGSSDAAAALTLLSRFWGIDADSRRLAAIGLQLGADVPMCLAARPLLARGIGERLEPLPVLPPLPILLVNPGVPLATPAVFGALLRRDNPALPPFGGGSDADAIAGWLRAARNDLEAPALSLAPEIGRALALLNNEGALIARMSGSGATCFGLFRSEAEAARAEEAIARGNPGWFVRATATMAPAPELGHV